MNWIALAAIAGVFAAIVGPATSIVVGVFFYGKLTQSAIDTKEDVKEIKGDVKELKENVAEHGEAIASLRGPRYVNGASR